MSCRRKQVHRFAFCLTLGLATATAACEEPPTREMNQAEGALDTARVAGAAEYAAAEFLAAETALSRSRQAVEERDFRQALNFALDARTRAQAATRLAADEQARLRTEADRALRATEVALAEAKARLLGAAGVSAPILERARTAIVSAEAAVEASREAFDAAHYGPALAPLADANARLTTTISEIDAAAIARPARRPTRRNR